MEEDLKVERGRIEEEVRRGSKGLHVHRRKEEEKEDM